MQIKNDESTLTLTVPRKLKTKLVKSANGGKMVEFSRELLERALKLKPHPFSSSPDKNMAALIVSLEENLEDSIFLGIEDYTVGKGWSVDYSSPKKLKTLDLKAENIFWIEEDLFLVFLMLIAKKEMNEERAKLND